MLAILPQDRDIGGHRQTGGRFTRNFGVSGGYKKLSDGQAWLPVTSEVTVNGNGNNHILQIHIVFRSLYYIMSTYLQN